METKVINGKEYGCEKLPATKGLALQLKVAKFIGGSLGELRNMGGSSEAILSALGSFAASVDDEDFAKFVKETVLLARVMVDAEGELIPRAIDFDWEFSEDYLTMWEVMGFVLEVNLGKFLSDIKSRFVKSIPKEAAKKDN
jgi:hypothetical protein